MNINQFDWQTIVAVIIVVAAIGVLVRKMWNTFFTANSTGCGTSCSSCPAGSKSQANRVEVTQLVQLDATEHQSTGSFSQRQTD